MHELDGGDHFPITGDSDAIVDEVEEFVTGTRTGTEPDRVLATLLFTDIVDSTRTAADLGDRRWHALLDEHRLLVRRDIERFRGRELATTGDGFLASFDGPGPRRPLRPGDRPACLRASAWGSGRACTPVSSISARTTPAA